MKFLSYARCIVYQSLVHKLEVWKLTRSPNRIDIRHNNHISVRLYFNKEKFEQLKNPLKIPGRMFA